MRGFKCPTCGSNRLHQITSHLSRRSEVVSIVPAYRDALYKEDLLCSGSEIFTAPAYSSLQKVFYTCADCVSGDNFTKEEVLALIAVERQIGKKPKPRLRINIYGGQGSGKSQLAMHITEHFKPEDVASHVVDGNHTFTVNPTPYRGGTDSVIITTVQTHE